jgi:hypothetical protein
MLYKNTLIFIVISAALVTSCSLYSQRGRTGFDHIQPLANDDAAYKKIYDHYSDILECFYVYERADYEKKDFYFKKMISTIVRCVEGDMLPLYGNFFSRMWRNTTACSDSNFPLKKLDTLLVEDALGHLHKQYAHKETTPVVDLIRSLNHIRQLVRQSAEYRCEELVIEKRALDSKISLLKSEVKSAQSECERLRSKLALYEPTNK